ncbi:MAG: polysaccharide biosynthesis tyrosine autokinase [Candidatus Omnitrophica bacterium]|nr:polysaccharide biosynthesis tyrosine autokinase [Candidatus Omnitrophota bacterium]
MLPNPEVREVTINDYLKVVQKRLGLIITLLVIIPAVAAIVVFTKKPIYRSTASIMIERSTPRVTKFEEVTPSYYWAHSQEYYQTQYKILSSRNLVERIFGELRLAKDAEFQDVQDPVGKLHNQIRIDPVKSSQIVLIHVEDTDALRASAVANALAKAYIQQDIDTRNHATKEAAAWLEGQLSGVKNTLRESEQALSTYIQENKFVTIPDVEKKTESVLESLKQTKNKVEAELAEARKRYKGKHPRMVALEAQSEDIKKKIEEETDNVLELNQKLVQYNLLKKELDSSQQLYTSILMRAKETDVTEKLQVSNIRIIDSAQPPKSPYKPQKAKVLLMSLLFSILCGVGLAFLLEYLDATIRTADDVSLYLNLPFLGYIPSVGVEAATDKDKSLLCFNDAKSETSESCRAIRTSILFASPEDKPIKSILVTSAVPKEGKTFVASSLSIIFSQLNEKVILLDIDMRKPKMHKNFNIEQKTGLSNYLTGNINLDEVIKQVCVPNLSVVASGNIPPNPSELLSSSKVRQLFDELKDGFDKVIVDSPPVLIASDALLLANIVDGVVLLVHGGKTRIDTAQQAKAKILEAKGKIIGVVINNVQPEKEDKYYYYHYYNYGEGEKRERQVKKTPPGSTPQVAGPGVKSPVPSAPKPGPVKKGLFAAFMGKRNPPEKPSANS